jgi:hypothetical protein
VDDLVAQRACLGNSNNVSVPCSSHVFALTPWQTEQARLEQVWLASDVSCYTRDVEAFLCVSNRKGLKHKPATQVEVMLLQYKQWERQIQVLEGIEDVLRFSVSHSSSSSRLLSY